MALVVGMGMGMGIMNGGRIRKRAELAEPRAYLLELGRNALGNTSRYLETPAVIIRNIPSLVQTRKMFQMPSFPAGLTKSMRSIRRCVVPALSTHFLPAAAAQGRDEPDGRLFR